MILQGLRCLYKLLLCKDSTSRSIITHPTAWGFIVQIVQKYLCYENRQKVP